MCETGQIYYHLMNYHVVDDLLCPLSYMAAQQSYAKFIQLKQLDHFEMQGLKPVLVKRV